MMAMPSKKEMDLYNKICPWLRVVNDDKPYIESFLDPDAPSDVAEAYSEYVRKYTTKEEHWII